jgi:DNA-binding transcriptional LysR family regulator
MINPNFRTLDLNLLRVFDQVMSERNLTRAASNLAMTQPAVSNALRRLREALGDELVRRSGYGVEPTPRALALWPAIGDALRQIEASLAPGDFVASGGHQHLHPGHGRRHGGRADAGAGGDH